MHAAKPAPREAAEAIRQQKFPGCKAFFLTGSVIKPEATAHSDLDLVVIFESLEAAWRESFLYKGWPVEVFVHDLQTFKYFLQLDARAAKPYLARMVSTAVALPENDFSNHLKDFCLRHLDEGPAALTPEELDRKRYAITDLIDDLRSPRSHAEAMATGARLLEDLADFYFRANNLWTTDGKTIFRRLAEADAKVCHRFETAFNALFAASDASLCIGLAEDLLQDWGGFLFDGYRHAAPSSWKIQ